jgi:aflatoxin B1 aldehyde reductase
MGKARINIFFGAGSVGSGPEAKITSAGQLQPVLELLEKRGYQNIDTARTYAPGTIGTSETLMGETFAASKSNYSGWTIDTKVRSFFPGAHEPANITKGVTDSLAALGIGRVHTLYLHGPDRQTSFEATYKALQAAYEQGAFEKVSLGGRYTCH